MPNLVDFLVRVKDMASGPLEKLAGTGSRSFAKLDKGATATGNRIDKLGGTVQKVDQKLNSLSRSRQIKVDTSGVTRASQEVDKLNAKLERTSRQTHKGGGLFSGASGSGGGFGLGLPPGLGRLFGGVAVGATIGSIAGAGMQRDATNMRFNVLAGEAEGGKLSKNLADYANKSIYGNEVFDNAQTMMAFDISAKKVMPTIDMLGDVAMGNAQRMGALTLAFSQVNAAGKLTGQDLLQFVNAGFNPLQEISKKTGKSMAELREEMSDGKITFKQVEDAFKGATSAGGRFYNMTEKLNKTTFGKWEAFKGSVAGLSAELGQSWSPFLSGLLDAGYGVVNFVSDNRTRLESLFDPIKDAAKPINSIFDDIYNRAGNLNNPESLNAIFNGVRTSLDFLAPTLKEMSGVIGSLYKVSLQLKGSYDESGWFKEAVNTTALGTGKLFQGTSLTLGTAAQNLIYGLGDHGSALMGGGWGKYESGTKRIHNAFNGDPKINNQIQGIFDAKTYDQLLRAANPEAFERDANAQKAHADKFYRSVRPVPFAPLKPGSSFADLFGAGTGFGSFGPGASEDKATSVPSSVADTAKGISGGGVRNITINLGKHFDDIHIHAATVDEGLGKLEEKVMDVFLRVLNSANSMAS